MAALTDRAVNNALAAARINSNADLSSSTAAQTVANQCDQRIHTYPLFSSVAGTAATTYNFQLARTDRLLKPIEVRILPGGALTASDTNYDTITFYFNNDAGGANTNFALAATSATVSVPTGSWVQGNSVLIPLVSSPPNIPAASSIGVSFVATGTGVSIPLYTAAQIIWQEV